MWPFKKDDESGIERYLKAIEEKKSLGNLHTQGEDEYKEGILKLFKKLAELKEVEVGTPYKTEIQYSRRFTRENIVGDIESYISNNSKWIINPHPVLGATQNLLSNTYVRFVKKDDNYIAMYMRSYTKEVSTGETEDYKLYRLGRITIKEKTNGEIILCGNKGFETDLPKFIRSLKDAISHKSSRYRDEVEEEKYSSEETKKFMRDLYKVLGESK